MPLKLALSPLPAVRRYGLTMRWLSVCAALVLVSVASAAGDYSDPQGDGSSDGDITAVAVSHTDTTITMRVGIADAPTLRDDHVLRIFFDTDGNRETGGSLTLVQVPGLEGRRTGAEFRAQLYGVTPDLPTLGRFTRGGFELVDTYTASYDNGWTFTFPRSAIGDPARFDFWLIQAGTDDTGHAVKWADHAPDASTGLWGWTYELGGQAPPPTPPAPRLAAGKLSLTPSAPKAGATLVARMTATNAKSITCRLALAGRSVRGRGLLAGSATRCTWKLPAALQGLAIGVVTIKNGTSSVSRRFSVRVR